MAKVAFTIGTPSKHGYPVVLHVGTDTFGRNIKGVETTFKEVDQAARAFRVAGDTVTITDYSDTFPELVKLSA